MKIENCQQKIINYEINRELIETYKYATSGVLLNNKNLPTEDITQWDKKAMKVILLKLASDTGVELDTANVINYSSKEIILYEILNAKEKRNGDKRGRPMTFRQQFQL